MKGIPFKRHLIILGTCLLLLGIAIPVVTHASSPSGEQKRVQPATRTQAVAGQPTSITADCSSPQTLATLNKGDVFNASATLTTTDSGEQAEGEFLQILDGSVTPPAVLLTVDDNTGSGSVTFTATVSNDPIQACIINIDTDETGTITFTVSHPNGPTTLFVFVQGIDSKFGPGIDNPFFDPNGIQPFLAKNYPQAAFLNFSYFGSDNAGQPLPYTCLDTFQQHISFYVTNLSLQLRSYLAQNPSITKVYLVSHSMGGVVSLGYLAFLDTTSGGLKGPIPGSNAHIAGVITLDSPLGGVTGGLGGIYEELTLLFHYDKDCNGLLFGSHASFDDLTKLFTTTTPRGGSASIYNLLFNVNRSNQNLAQEAHADGINVLTVGNYDDYVFAPKECIPQQIFGPAFRDSQYLHDQGNTSGIYGRQIVAGTFPCSAGFDPFTGIGRIAENHTTVLFDLSVKLGIQQFVNGQPLTALAPPA